MSQARNKILAKTEHIQSLRLTIVFLVIVVIAQWLRNGYLQDTRRIYIPPDLTQGVMTYFEDVPPPIIYTFGLYIFQQLHRWKKDGEQDYQRQIYNLQGFLTPQCVRALTEDMNEKMRRGELRNRVRSIQEIYGHSYDEQRVSIESKQSWLLWLDFNIKENISGHPVKDVNVRYRLKVVRYDVDKEVNPWGLAIDCDEKTKPVLIPDDDIGKAFKRQVQ